MDTFERRQRIRVEITDETIEAEHFHQDIELIYVLEGEVDVLMVSYETVSDIVGSIDVIFWCNSTLGENEHYGMSFVKYVNNIRLSHAMDELLYTEEPIPDVHIKHERQVLKGELTSPIDPKKCCRFAARCPYATEKCLSEEPALREMKPNHVVACHYAENFMK